MIVVRLATNGRRFAMRSEKIDSILEDHVQASTGKDFNRDFIAIDQNCSVRYGETFLRISESFDEVMAMIDVDSRGDP